MMNLIKLAIRNIGRNRRRTLLTASAIALSTLFIIFAQSYFKGIIDGFFDSLIRLETGHVKIASKEYHRLEHILPKEHLIQNYEALNKEIKSLPSYLASTERIKFRLVLSFEDKTEPCMGVGINPVGERPFINLEKIITQGRMLSPSSRELVIGTKLAQKLGIESGDKVLAVTTDINYSTYALVLRVVGLFESGYSNIDKHIFYLPLATAQELLDCKGAVHEILLLTKDSSKSIETGLQIEEILKQKDLDTELSTVSWQNHFMVKGSLPMANGMIFGILFIIVAIAGLVILNTMLMAVLERTHEIGIMKSMGMKDKSILLLILIESFFIGVIGIIIGGISGSGLSMLLQKTGINISIMSTNIDIPIPVMSSILYPKFTWTILLISIVFALTSAVLAAVYPAWKASRLAPVDALRSTLK